MPFSALLRPPLLPLLYSRWKCSSLALHAETTRHGRAHPTFLFFVVFSSPHDESTRNIPVTAACTRRRAAAVRERFPRKRAGRKMLPMRSRSWNFIARPPPGGGGGGDGVGRGVLCYRSSSGVTVLGRVGKQLLEEAELFRELAIQTFVVVFFWSKLTQRRQIIRII